MSHLRRLALEHQDRLLICDCGFPTELRARTASFKWQVSPLLLYSLPWHRARTEPSRKVSCQSASCRATLFGGSREKCHDGLRCFHPSSSRSEGSLPPG